MKITKQRKSDLTLAAWGWIMLVWSTVFSYKQNPEFSEESLPAFDLNDPTTIYGTGGFPMEVYDYPFPPLGPGPEQSTLPLLANFLFWTIITFGVMRLAKIDVNKKTVQVVTSIIFIVSTIAWFGYLGLKFD